MVVTLTLTLPYYLSFSSQILKERPGLGVTDVMKEVGGRWSKLSAQEKLPFEELAKKDKERYNQEMKLYNASKSDD